MIAPAPAVFTVAPGAPFLSIVVAALREGRLIPGFPDPADPLSLSRATLYLPTRRAGRLMEEALVAACGARASLLPRIVALGDIDEDELATTGELAAGELGAGVLPDAIAPLTRRLLLARLVAALAGSPALREGPGAAIATAPASALALADELAALMDRMATGRVDWARLDELVPESLDEFWQISIRFLKEVATKAWPAILAERGVLDPAVRRDLLCTLEAERLAAGAADPVIVAGSTGSVPATRALIAAIARHPQGCVVLPGLDTHLDAAAWALLAPADGEPIPTHPQFGFAQLLAAIGIAREEVRQLGPPTSDGRDRLLSRALRPAATTDAWATPDPALDAAAALRNVALVVTEEPQEEALAAAVALREVLEEDGRTATLITPDRTLARRVAADLTRWGIEVDDSAGLPLADTPAGVFSRLVAEVAANELAPVALLALLNHPATFCGLSREALASAREALELAVLRGPRPKAGIAGLRASLSSIRATITMLHRRDARRALTEFDFERAAGLIERLGRALSVLGVGTETRPFAELLAAHRTAIGMLSCDGDGDPSLRGTDAEALEALFDDLVVAAPDATPMDLADYAEMWPLLMSGIAVRRPLDATARVRILGPLEARLMPLDRVVIAGLDEDRWPPQVTNDPWLSRPMRRTLGLDLPERRIGLSAHDFAQAFGAPEVVLVRARKSGGAPTVPARFLQRLAAVSGVAWAEVEARGSRFRAMARMVDAAPAAVRIARPNPAPDVRLRPRQLSVTEIEDWVRDPYTIFARHVLRLSPLDPPDAEIAAAARGTIVHDALARFLASHPDDLPDDALARLLDCGRAAFAAVAAFPELVAVWWPRFERVARWFVAEERTRRAGGKVHSLVECGARYDLPGAAFTLTCRADRIDLAASGATVIDYKTGQPPTNPQVESGFAPQLPLEAAMLAAGAFHGVPAGTAIAGLAYVRLGGGDPPGVWRAVRPKSGTAADLAGHTLARLTELVARFADPAQGYASLVSPKFEGQHGDYDHLARIAEWSAAAGLDNGEDGA